MWIVTSALPKSFQRGWPYRCQTCQPPHPHEPIPCNKALSIYLSTTYLSIHPSILPTGSVLWENSDRGTMAVAMPKDWPWWSVLWKWQCLCDTVLTVGVRHTGTMRPHTSLTGSGWPRKQQTPLGGSQSLLGNMCAHPLGLFRNIRVKL